ncbi:hypothetical protein A7D17_10540 [Xanthomonas floridensis]|uniref:Uncharacterized protein n=1 Tax=Xanthomonas floridensis TaxID=1843580 RepID=A0A1A9MHB6_9XANT|nr:hypothetical protein A7D17_10540 [Xanthomonas floridensis]
MQGARTPPLPGGADASVWHGAMRGQSFRQGREHGAAGGTGAQVLTHRDPDVQGNANLPRQHRQQARRPLRERRLAEADADAASGTEQRQLCQIAVGTQRRLRRGGRRLCAQRVSRNQRATCGAK